MLNLQEESEVKIYLYIIKHYTMKAYGALYKAPWSHCIGA
jgi:hypothetical protein